MKCMTPGNTGLEVSRLCLGCMDYARRRRATKPGLWMRNPAGRSSSRPRPFIKQALEFGQLLRHHQCVLCRVVRGDPRSGDR